jgi:hypothetical protein
VLGIGNIGYEDAKRVAIRGGRVGKELDEK